MFLMDLSTSGEQDITSGLSEPLRSSLECLDRASHSILPYRIGEEAVPQQPVSIDCENRLALCHAACCRLRFALSASELEVGILQWDPDNPFLILQDAQGRCAHLEEESCRCSVYEHRPSPCRNFDCRHDDRIWLSFEERLVNPAVNRPGWPLIQTTEE